MGTKGIPKKGTGKVTESQEKGYIQSTFRVFSGCFHSLSGNFQSFGGPYPLVSLYPLWILPTPVLFQCFLVLQFFHLCNSFHSSDLRSRLAALELNIGMPLQSFCARGHQYVREVIGGAHCTETELLCPNLATLDPTSSEEPQTGGLAILNDFLALFFYCFSQGVHFAPKRGLWQLHEKSSTRSPPTLQTELVKKMFCLFFNPQCS